MPCKSDRRKPPFASSPSAAQFVEKYPEEFKDLFRQVPLVRHGDGEADIGRAIVCLVSDNMSYITGAAVMIDGGQTVLT